MGRAIKRLNARFVETVREAGRYTDGDGLYLIVDMSCRKRWLFRYRLSGKRRDMGLGG